MQSIDAILLIHKQLTNQISSKEKKILKSWLKDDDHNRNLHKDISMIWSASKKSFDPSNYTKSKQSDKSEYNKQDDISGVANLSFLKPKYKNLDPGQELTKTIVNKRNDLFSQLMLSGLSPKELDKLQNINLEIDLKSILQILSSTAIIILSGEYLRYHLDILDAIEQFSSVKGILISNLDDKVIYATNKKFNNTYLLELFPVQSIIFEKLKISDLKEYQLVALPVYHQFGRIGMVMLMI